MSMSYFGGSPRPMGTRKISMGFYVEYSASSISLRANFLLRPLKVHDPRDLMQELDPLLVLHIEIQVNSIRYHRRRSH